MAPVSASPTQAVARLWNRQFLTNAWVTDISGRRLHGASVTSRSGGSYPMAAIPEPSTLLAAAGGIDTVTGIAPGLYRLHVQLIGYHTLRDTLRIGTGEAWCITAHLVRQPIELPNSIRLPEPIRKS